MRLASALLFSLSPKLFNAILFHAIDLKTPYSMRRILFLSYEIVSIKKTYDIHYQLQLRAIEMTVIWNWIWWIRYSKLTIGQNWLFKLNIATIGCNIAVSERKSCETKWIYLLGAAFNMGFWACFAQHTRPTEPTDYFCPIIAAQTKRTTLAYDLIRLCSFLFVCCVFFSLLRFVFLLFL